MAQQVAHGGGGDAAMGGPGEEFKDEGGVRAPIQAQDD